MRTQPAQCRACPQPRAAVRAMLAASLVAVVVGAARAQSFSRDLVAGPIVTDAIRTLGGTWVDYDVDGDLDLYTSGDGCQMYVNLGDGTFSRLLGESFVENPGEYFWCVGVWGDVDDDGNPDLYRANIGTLDASGAIVGPGPDVFYRNLGPRNFLMDPVPLEGDSIESVAVSYVDYERDGDLDIFVSGDGHPDLFYRNEGGGAFARLTSPAFIDVAPLFGTDAWVDVDRDGDDDLYVVNSNHPNDFYWNRLVESGSPTFEADPAHPLVTQVTGFDIEAAWGDYDRDGDLDVFVSTALSQVDFLFESDGAGGFTRVTGMPLTDDVRPSLFGLWGDYDNDADLDLLVGRTATGPAAPVLFVNDGAGGLAAHDGTGLGDLYDPQPGVSCGQWVDYDGDGDLDFCAVNLAQPNTLNGVPQQNRLYRNEGNANRWLFVRCEGTISARDAVGARVEVVATIGGESIRQHRLISGSMSGNLSQADKRAHFGLGDASVVEEIQVFWPSGATSTVNGVAVDQEVTVVEPEVVGVDGSEPNAPAESGSHPPIRIVAANPFRADDRFGVELDPDETTWTFELFRPDGTLAHRTGGVRHAAGVVDAWQAPRAGLSPGVYLYRVSTSRRVTSGRIVIADGP